MDVPAWANHGDSCQLLAVIHGVNGLVIADPDPTAMAGDPSAGGRRRAGAIGERTHCGEHVGAGGLVEIMQMLAHPRTSFHAVGAGQGSVPEFGLDLLRRDRLARLLPGGVSLGGE